MRLSIPQVTNVSAALTALAIVSAAFGVYIFGSSLGQNAQQQRTELAARLASDQVEMEIEHHREIARRLAARVAEEHLLSDSRSAARSAFIAATMPALPQVMKIRMVPAGSRETDATSVPQFGFACLDLIDRIEKNESVPNAELHMPGTPSAHIDVVATIRGGPPSAPAILGHVVLSVNPATVKNALTALQSSDGYAELHQPVAGAEPIVVASGGDSSLKTGAAVVTRTIKNSNWRLAVWPAPAAATPSAGVLLAAAVAALVALGLFVLSSLLPRRSLADAVQHDAGILTSLFHDIRAGSLMGQYPFRLREFAQLAKQIRHSGEEMIQDRRHLEKIVQLDTLTGLATQPVFEQRLEKLLQQARLGFSSAVLVAEIDSLDEIATTLGPEAGDALLKKFARQLRRALRQGDVVARLDGGRFGVLFPLADLVSVQPVVERLRDRLSGEFDPGNGTTRRYSWSAGLTLFSNTDLDSAACLSRAEKAIATARHEGGNRTVTHVP